LTTAHIGPHLAVHYRTRQAAPCHYISGGVFFLRGVGKLSL